nr:MAG TPA: hypothetical protein [Bacteriophage sp.]
MSFAFLSLRAEMKRLKITQMTLTTERTILSISI